MTLLQSVLEAAGAEPGTRTRTRTRGRTKMIASARSSSPYGASRGHESPNGDYTASYENFGDRAPPYDFVSKSTFNCTDNYQL